MQKDQIGQNKNKGLAVNVMYIQNIGNMLNVKAKKQKKML